MTIFGWDASDFDHGRGPMDMAAARRDGIDFYTHKATEGTSVRHNPGPSMAAARAAGIPFLGCYLVPRSGPSIASQVDYFLQWVTQQVPWWPNFPGWFWQMDTEHWGYDNVPASVGHQAAQLLAARTGRRVLHYAPEWAYGDSVPAGEPLWASNYVTGSGPYRSLYPGDASSRWHAYSGRTPAVLQYTSSATIGNQSGCDANAFRGAVADFAALIGTTTTGGDMAEFRDVKLGQGPSTAYSDQYPPTALAWTWAGVDKANAALAALQAAAAADEQRDNATLAAVKALAVATGADPQPILDAVAAARQDTHDLVVQLQQQVAHLEARNTRLAAALAAAGGALDQADDTPAGG